MSIDTGDKMDPTKFRLDYTRLGTLEDAEAITRLTLKLLAKTGYGSVKINPAKIRQTVESFIMTSPDKTLMLVSVTKDGVVGYIAAMPFDQPFTDEEIALELGWHVAEGTPDEKQRLLELRAGYEHWAKLKGIRFCQYAVLQPSAEDFERLRKQGKTKVLELIYQREV